MTALIEGIYQRKTQHWAVYVALVGLVTGAVLANSGSDRTKVTTAGLVAALLQVVFSSSKYVFAHGILKKQKGKLGSLALLFWLDLFMIPIYVPWTLINGELGALFGQSRPAAEWVRMLLTSGLGGVRALTQFIVLFFVSATSMSTANIFTQVLNILISLPIEHTAVSALLVLGITFTIASSAAYTYLKTNQDALKRIDDCTGRRAEPEPGSRGAGLLAP